MTGTLAPDAAAARDALAAAAARTAELIASTGDTTARVPDSEWTVAEAAAHLVIALRGFTDAARGQDGRWAERIPQAGSYTERLTSLNQASIAAEPARGPAAAAAAITEAAQEFLAATAPLPAGHTIRTPWYGPDATHTVATATCLLLGEQVVHGYDIAAAVGRPWPIARADARLIFGAVAAMLPLAADPAAIGATSASCELRLGGGTRLVIRISGGTVAVQQPPAGRVDCHVAAEPVAFLLVSYGRISQWRAIATGKMITWGRRPWLAFRFRGFFHNP